MILTLPVSGCTHKCKHVHIDEQGENIVSGHITYSRSINMWKITGLHCKDRDHNNNNNTLHNEVTVKY